MIEKTSIYTVRELLTPAAAMVLAKSTVGQNRKVSKPYVRMLVAEMKGGRWKENGESIKCDRQGRLVDGQHRCWACALSGIPIWVQMTYNVEEEARETLDIGRKRSSFDRLLVEGLSASKKGSEVLHLLLKLSRANKNETVVSHKDLCDAYRTIGIGVEEACKEAQAFLSAGGRTSSNAFEVATYYLFKSTHNDTNVKNFFEKLYSAVNVPAGTNYGKVRSEIRKNKEKIQRISDHYENLSVIVRLYLNDTTRTWAAISKHDMDYMDRMLKKIPAGAIND